MAEMKEVFEKAERKMGKSIEHLEEEYAAVRAGGGGVGSQGAYHSALGCFRSAGH